MDYETLGNPDLGIRVYKSNLNANLANELDKRLSNEQSCDKWSLALVGYSQVPNADYRNCHDFKMSAHQVDTVQERIGEIYSFAAEEIRRSVMHYSVDYGINMGFMEAINFVKYSAGEHFSYHSDHGYHYVCTVSTVAYLNDNYQGGELAFNKLDLKIKPSEGDIVVFPSSFIYSHASLPVTKGTKFAAVTMFDYDNGYSEFRKTLLSKH